ncbi:helix-turn-helix domain-containing protein [Streptomyces litchfieldiae]|uniref:Helix-turn-helix transcriptional regulator n=1 Tax=Streptomyces litchfieldiae TaxID=3075543 RepID=A0ABU2MIU7_9ACTN|nr:helix-turn-helix transcriptional regulator [Streptomyces sp. DSM 44938]MDT0341400.1 helix-turn-helix transcriptional regulator [Streptomyces sp. DSM 44938]
MPARKPISGRGKPSARRMLAEELDRLRNEAGWSLRQLADKLGWDHTHLYKLEKGEGLGSPDVIAALDETYGTTPHLMMLWELARADVFRDTCEAYVKVESQARILHKYTGTVLPGLLQTEAYARELLGTANPRADDVDVRVAARLRRQRILDREDPAEFRAVVDESVLRRPLADPAAWRDQLGHLVRMAERPHITLQVLRFSAGLHGLSGTDTMLMWLPGGKALAYTETGYSGELISDQAGVDRLRRAYDGLRDRSLPPPESLAFIERLREKIPAGRGGAAG